MADEGRRSMLNTSYGAEETTHGTALKALQRDLTA